MSGRAIPKESRDGAALTQEVNPRSKPKRRWTPQEVALVEQLYAQGVRPSQVAARVGASRYQIEALLEKLSIPRTQRAPSLDWRLSREEQFAELLSLGFTIRRIGEIMGYKDRQSANATFQRIRRHMGPQAR
jgi:hypothetical protein